MLSWTFAECGAYAGRHPWRPARSLKREIVDQPDHLCRDRPEAERGCAHSRSASDDGRVRTNRCVNLQCVGALTDIRENKIECVSAAGVEHQVDDGRERAGPTAIHHTSADFLSQGLNPAVENDAPVAVDFLAAEHRTTAGT